MDSSSLFKKIQNLFNIDETKEDNTDDNIVGKSANQGSNLLQKRKQMIKMIIPNQPSNQYSKLNNQNDTNCNLEAFENYYQPLIDANDSEQNTLGALQDDFNQQLSSYGLQHKLFMDDYMGAQTNRRACKEACKAEYLNAGIAAEIGADAASTNLTQDQAVQSVIDSCNAGCDLKVPGIFNVDAGQTIGKYQNTTINQCSDLNKFAPKVEIGGQCDADSQCKSTKCSGNGANNGADPDNVCQNTCVLLAHRVNGLYSWNNDNLSLCKAQVDTLGLVRQNGANVFFILDGLWMKVANYGWPGLIEIPNTRDRAGNFIADFNTAIKAAEAYGPRCKGLVVVNGGEGYKLIDSGTGVVKPSWDTFKAQMNLLTGNTVENFQAGLDSNQSALKNNNGAIDIKANSKFAQSIDPSVDITKNSYNNPTFPINAMVETQKVTCPKGWTANVNGKCQVSNPDMIYKCNLDLEKDKAGSCASVPDNKYYCWKTDSCYEITGKQIMSCEKDGGQMKPVLCPKGGRMTIFIGRKTTSQELSKILLKIKTIYPDAGLSTEADLQHLTDMGYSRCACGWYNKDGTTTIGFYSTYKTASGCGDGKQGIVSCDPKSGNKYSHWWGNVNPYIYITLTANPNYIVKKMAGINFNIRILETPEEYKKVPDKKCIPVARFLTHENDASKLWETRCAGLDNNECVSNTEWPNGSGGRCQMGYNEGFANIGGNNNNIENNTIREGFTKMETDMLWGCNETAQPARTGEFLIQEKKMLKSKAAKLQSSANNIVTRISQMQTKHMAINPVATKTNTDLLATLAKYQEAKAKLLATSGNVDTVSAQLEDVKLKKNSGNLTYLLWLSLAISILLLAIRKTNF